MAKEHPSILVVDDEADTCANLSDILTDLGYHVDTAADGPTALELVKQHPYDVALLDLKMPGMDGLELYREIRKLQADTVAILVTAYASSSTADEALDAGAWKILPKPVEFPKLLALVDEAVEQTTVLLVDDDHDTCDSLWDIFREQGYRVGVAHALGEVKQCLENKEFHVVLIDMKLPEGDGHEVYKCVRECNPAARAVLITGHRSELESQINQVLSEGADAVCYKPFQMDNLISTLRKLTAEA